MSTEAVSPLRRRMIEDMTIRQFGTHTQRDYVRQVREFTAFIGRSPDQAEPEDLRRYQLHLASLEASYSRMNHPGRSCNLTRQANHLHGGLLTLVFATSDSETPASHSTRLMSV